LTTTNLVTTNPSVIDPSAGTVVASNAPSVTPSAPASFADQGEAGFKSGDFKAAEYALRHAVIDDSQNPVLVMMLSQALFANGKFDEAAGAVQAGMQQLPKDQWGVVVKNYKDLYGGGQAYTDQLRALEKAVKDKPEDPGLRFLLGYHYGFLGYPTQAVEQLDKTLKVAPQDEMAKQLRDELQPKQPKAATPDVTPIPGISK
jgi:thioredoxin-like negative regulator of GroEL